jgi:peptidoglycan/xylan/chitin deacetylase (PgdA/CDA1 family)
VIAALLALLVMTPPRRVAITFDDLPGGQMEADGCNVSALTSLNHDLVAAIRRNRIPAVGFVNGGRCRDQSPEIQRILSTWLDNGLDLGNHTASHIDLNRVSLEDYERDLLSGEVILRPLLSARGTTLRWFRFPFLHTGKDLQKKRGFETFLGEHGYTNVPVTIDNDDYLYAIAYSHALAARDHALARRIAGDYIRYMDSIFAFYEKFSRDVLGYEPPHILLLHGNRLNADHLDRLAAMIRKRGYKFISVEEALRDPAYRRVDNYIGGAGISWLHRWALDMGKPAPDQPEANIPAHHSPFAASTSSAKP